jgi:hypothetical protein
MFQLRKHRLGWRPISRTKEQAERPGGILSISANGALAGTGIVWALTASENANQQVVPGTLRAFDATDLSREIWNSRQNGMRDDFGFLAKFNTPIVANGKVYVATFSKQVVGYGLLPDARSSHPSMPHWCFGARSRGVDVGADGRSRCLVPSRDAVFKTSDKTLWGASLGNCDFSRRLR